MDARKLQMRELLLNRMPDSMVMLDKTHRFVFANAAALTAIFSSDANGVIVEFNPAAQAMFGMGREQALGRTVTEVMVPERHRSGHIASMNRIAMGGAPRLMGQPLSMHAIRADGTESLMQMVLNLLVNAQQALNTCGGRREAGVSTGAGATGTRDPGAGPTVWLRVANNGPGVPQAVRDHIFDPYFTTKGEGMGTGLGLAVSRSVARKHGGDLTLGPSAGGARVVLRLPIKPSQGALPPQDGAQADQI